MSAHLLERALLQRLGNHILTHQGTFELPYTYTDTDCTLLGTKVAFH